MIQYSQFELCWDGLDGWDRRDGLDGSDSAEMFQSSRVGMFEMVQMGLCADGWDRWVGSDNCIMFEMIGMVGAVGMVLTMGSADSSHGVIRDE